MSGLGRRESLASYNSLTGPNIIRNSEIFRNEFFTQQIVLISGSVDNFISVSAGLKKISSISSVVDVITVNLSSAARMIQLHSSINGTSYILGLIDKLSILSGDSSISISMLSRLKQFHQIRSNTETLLLIEKALLSLEGVVERTEYFKSELTLRYSAGSGISKIADYKSAVEVEHDFSI
jgi:hypothetical protein